MIEDIARKFLENRYLSAAEVETILTPIEDNNSYDWRDLSDQNNNIGGVRMTGEEEHTLIERLTNSIDACLEKKARKYPEITRLKNPSQVKAFLEEKQDPLTDKDVVVGIYPHDRKTNFYFEDKGIGILNENMPYSILKISGSHKKDKNYLMGFYGKGGSSVCNFSPFTIILTGRDNQVSFTIIKYDDKTRKYRYLVDINNLDGSFSFNEKEHASPPERHLPPKLNGMSFSGTTVIHIDYDIKKTAIVDFQNIFDENMFKSLFKYTLHKPQTTEQTQQEIWHLDGLGNKLHRVLDKNHIRSTKISGIFDRNEDIEITYFYIEKKMSQKYVTDKRHRIFLTSNGQTHNRLPSTIIDEAKLGLLKDKLIIEVNCNHLSLDTKLEIFTSNRQGIDKKIGREIEEQIKNFIANDPFLDEQLEKLEEELLNTSSTKDTKEIRQEFAEMMKSYNEFSEFKIPGKGKGRGKGKEGKAKRKRGTDEDILLLDEPNFIKITNKANPIKAVINKNCEINLLANITDKSYRSNGYSIQIVNLLSKRVKYQVPDIKKGRTKAQIKFIDAEIGESIYVTFFLKANGKRPLLTESRKIEIVENEKENNNSGTAKGADSIDLKEVYRGDKNYCSDILGWDKEEALADFYDGKKNKVIYVNMSHTSLERFLGSLREVIDGRKLKMIKKEYFYNIAFSTFLIHKKDEEFAKLDLKALNGYKDLPDEAKIIDGCLLITANTIMRYLQKKYKK